MLFFFPGFVGLGNRYPIALKNLFEFSTGMLDDGTDYYYLNDDGIKKPLRMLRMGMFDPVLKEMLGLDKIQENDDKIQAIRSADDKKGKKRKAEHSEKIISKEKILTPNDYLICTRVNSDGSISSYSLLESPISNAATEIGASIISHHFIFLRPRVIPTAEIFTPFSHMLMDAIIEHYLAEKKKKSKQNVLSIKNLEKYVVNFPVDINDQQKIYEEYKRYKDDKSEAELNILKIQRTVLQDFEIINEGK